MSGDRHVTFNLAGINVTFPFEPYQIQREYMQCVIKAATNKQNALLESPTGTGKTLSLLCSSIAWQQSSKDQSKMIYYTSRTHIQLSQAAKEMKKTAYARVPAVVLASRTHMCLNDEVKQQSRSHDNSINRACKNATKRNACPYFTNYEQKMEKMDFDTVHDIEDLEKFGRQNQCCPYYASKKIAESKASLVFMPYNYLLDLSLRKTSKLRLERSVVIFDEGHNIESALKESASAQFTQNYLKVIQQSCLKLPEKLSAALNSELHGLSRYGYNPEKKSSAIVDEFAKPKEKKGGKEKEPKVNPIEELSEKLTNNRLQKVNECTMSLLECKGLFKTHQGNYLDTKCKVDTLYAKMDKAGVDFATSDQIIETLESKASFWSIASVMDPSTVAKYLAAITSLSHFIALLFPPNCKNKDNLNQHKEKLRKKYAVYLRAEVKKDTIFSNTTELIGWEMNLWCLHASIGLQRIFGDACIFGPRSIIITSGTLSPINSIEEELGIKFEIIKEFKHLIKDHQLKIVTLGQAADKYSLSSVYQDTKKPHYPKAIGGTLLNLFKVLPFGTITFFPSYSLMNLVATYWESQPEVSKNLCKFTKVYKESKDQETFASNMLAFKKQVDENGRAVFLGVCRGKLSEGTNLDRNYCRSVIVVGLPFPSLNDPLVKETKEFHSQNGDIGGQIWYTKEMRRALNQAFGRVIRNISDFGMLFLVDPRFTRYKFSVSDWIQPYYPAEAHEDVKGLPGIIKDFFSMHDIDVDTKNMCNLDGSQGSGGIFGLDQSSTTTRTIRPNFVSNNAFKNNSSEVSNGHEGAATSSNNRHIAPIRSNKDKQAEMLAAYTVNREEYNKIKNNQPHLSSASVRENEPPAAKRLKTTTEAMEAIYINDTCEPAFEEDAVMPVEQQQQQQQPEPQQQTKSQALPKPQRQPQPFSKKNPQTVPIETRSRVNEANCYVCMGPLVRPYAINCPCARLGCLTCIRGLNKKECGTCHTILKLKKFKPKLFNIFQKREV